MNLLFGQCGPITPDLSPALGFVREHFQAEADVKSFAHAACAGVRASGHLIGQASEGPLTLYYSGFFWKPLPGWNEAAPPLDQPDVVAALLLRRYQEMGRAFLDGLPAHYGLVLVDAAQRRVCLAADPYAQRTLFVGRLAGGLVFSSKLVVTARLMGAQLSVDRSWEDFFLLYGFYPHGRTPFAGVTALAPGEMLIWTNGQTERARIQPHKPVLPNIESGSSLDAVIEHLYAGFMQALDEQATGQNEVGVLLGGFDSALVAAGLKRLGKTVSTWSFSYSASEYNQPHVEDLSEYLGTRHEWVPIDEQLVREGIERFALLFNQPTNWPNYVIQTAVVCQKMQAAGLGFAYSGDGCDTVFLGYPGTWRRARVLEAVPQLGSRLSAMLLAMLAWPGLERRLGHPYRVLLNLVRTTAWTAHARGYLSFRILDELSLQQLRLDGAPPQERGIREAVEVLAAPHAGLPTLRLAYLGKAGVSPNRNKMSGSSDLTGMPILSPYLHPRFKALAQSLPEELCRPQQATASKVTGKYILMQMAERKGLLPAPVIYQKKVAAVDAPVDAWYAGTLRPFMLEMLRGLPFRASHEYLESLLQPHIAEQLFQKYLLTDKVIKHAPSLLATYARFCALAAAETS